MRIGIIADDLTGACDTAVQFVETGWRTELQLRPAKSAAQVVAITTDSRNRSESEAVQAVKEAVEELRKTGISRIFKKVDSTLRGHLSAEIEALSAAWSRDATMVVCPAFPAMGRTVRGGELRVDGLPVSETAASRDPLHPVCNSHIPSIVGGSQLAYEPAESIETLAERIRRARPIVVVDAATDAELLKLAHAIAALGNDVVPVGSAGLARQLAIAWTPDRAPRAAVVVMITSMHPMAERQTAALAEAGARICTPTGRDLVEDDEWRRWSSRIVDAYGARHGTVVLTPPATRHSEWPASLVPLRLARLAADLIASNRIAGLVTVGGDGARALLDAIGASGIALRRELSPGVPLGAVVGGPMEGLLVVTKAGAFGSDTTLTRAVEAVQQESR